MSPLVALEWVMSKLVSKFHRDRREAEAYDADKFLWPPQSLLTMTKTNQAAIRILPPHIVEIGEPGAQCGEHKYHVKDLYQSLRVEVDLLANQRGNLQLACDNGCCNTIDTPCSHVVAAAMKCGACFAIYRCSHPCV